MEPPQTPKKRKCEDSIRTVSPYFSPVKHRKVKGQGCLPAFDGSEQVERKDPLSLFYSRSRSKIYEELGQLKPKLIQEEVAGDKWKVFVACTLLNKTSAKLALPVFWDMMNRWPTPWAMSQADEEVLVSLLLRLGTQNIRAKRLISLSTEFIKDPPSLYDYRPSRASTQTQKMGRRYEKYPATPVSHLPSAGPYALDSYRIFCTGHDDPTSTEWQSVSPGDKELIRYLKWKWAVEEHRKWSPTEGPGPPATLSYLESLKSDLAYSSRINPKTPIK